MGKYKKLFFSLFKIGIIGFGGGSALIPVIEKTAVEDNKLINKEDYDVDVMVASITPGALPVEISAGIGKRLMGSLGLLLGAMVMALPGVIMTLFLLSILSYVNEDVLQQIGFITLGIYAFIFSLIVDYIKGTVHVAAGNVSKKEDTVKAVASALKKGNLTKVYDWSKKSSVVINIVLIIGVVILVSGKNLYRLLSIDADPKLSLSSLSVFVIAFFVILFTRGKFNLKNLIITITCCIIYILYKSKAEFISNKYLFIAICIIMAILSIYGIIMDYSETSKATKIAKATTNVNATLNANLTNTNFNKCIEVNSLKYSIKDCFICLAFLILCMLPAVLITKDSFFFVCKGFLSSLISFGGGDAYLTVADGMFVNTEMISETEFYSKLVPIVNVLPGSILCKTLSGVGYYIGLDVSQNLFDAILVALSGFAASIAASCGVFTIVAAIYDQFGSLPIFGLIRKSIRPIVSGLLVNVILSSLVQAKKQEEVFGNSIFPITLVIIIFAANRILSQKFKIRSELLVLISIAGSVIICNLVKLFM